MGRSALGVVVQSLICFVSDFGLDDTWVGVCHAVIHRACPQAQVVDMAHHIRPFDIRQGAAVATSSVHQVPDAIHLIVVDPGVGDGRRDICIVAKSGTRLVGPDNGVLIPATRRQGGVDAAYAIDSSKVDFRSPLATFHARDILAPVAAALACGVEPGSLGVSIAPESLVPAPFDEARLDGDTVTAEVLDIDRFGSVRISVASDQIEPLGLKADVLELNIGHHTLRAKVGLTFSDATGGEPVALVDSSGWLTLALNRLSAADRYGVKVGTPVRIQTVA